MAGRPFLALISKKIEILGGIDWFLGQVADAVPMKIIAAKLKCSRPFLYTWMDSDPTGERRVKYDAARVMSADILIDEGLEILDELGKEEILTGPDVAAATARANYRKGMAEMRDHSLKPKVAEVAVQVTINELHLDALRAHGSMANVLENKEIKVIEAEVLSDAE